MAEGERAQKVLARLGVASRRACDEMIRDGRVTINGVVAELGDRIVDGDEVTVDGVVLSSKPDAVLYLVNKPTGVVTTASDPQGRPTVMDLVPAEPRVFPVGRLDMDTEGLLLLTNDGDFTHLVTHPSSGVEKRYRATVTGQVSSDDCRRLLDGVVLEDGPARAKQARVLEAGPSSTVSVILTEGRKRQVRRMMEAIGYPVTALHRTSIGPIHDRHLALGEWRHLTDEEVAALYAATPTDG